MASLAVIGGTGLAQLPGFELATKTARETLWGEPSHPVLAGQLGGKSLMFLPRHGNPHVLPPHAINYRANLWLLRELGVEQVIAVNAVGGLRAELQPGTLLVPDQIIDYTWGREHTYFDGHSDRLEHIDFSWPYHESLRQRLIAVLTDMDCESVSSGTYSATQGPRLETAAEVAKLALDGGDVVGMTGMPEAALARELGLAYASVCVVVNPGAGLSDAPITIAGMQGILAEAAQRISELLSGLLQAELD